MTKIKIPPEIEPPLCWTITGYYIAVLCCTLQKISLYLNLCLPFYLCLTFFSPLLVYANGGHDLPSLNSSGPNSINEEPPPELPLLPPAFPAFMQPAPPPMMPYPADTRPAPLGRRSPPHGGRGRRDDSRSPSPGVPYGGDNRGGRGNFPRDVSPTPSDRSDRSSRYASSSYDYDERRYSPPYHAPPPPPRHRRRHSPDDRSPDR